MESVLIAFFFCLGAICASFAGVLAGRLHTGQSIARGRSRCDACGATLLALDLVPIFSHLLRGGRARCCGARISLSSTLGELVLGALFAASFFMLGATLLLPLFLACLVLLYALVRYDFAHQILPPRLLYPFLALALAYAALAAPSRAAFLTALAIASALGLFLFAIYALSRGRAMGFADSPLTFALALLAAPRALAGFAFSFWIGAVVGILLISGRKGVKMKSEVPLAPYLAAGFLLAYFLLWDPFAPLLSLIAPLP